MLVRTFSVLVAAFAIAVIGAHSPHSVSAVRLVQDTACDTVDLSNGATTINFDNRSAGEHVVDQYRDDGVRFIGESAVADAPAGAAPRSGKLAIRSQYAELGSAGRPIRMEFTVPMQIVAMFVGREDIAGDPEVIRTRLSAYGSDSSGTTTVIAASETTLERDATFGRCLVVHAPEELSITSAVLEYTTASDASSHEKRWLDDLTLLPAEDLRDGVVRGNHPEDRSAIGEPPASPIETPQTAAAKSWQWQLLMMVTGAMLMLGCFVGWHWRKDASVLSDIDTPGAFRTTPPGR